MGAPRRPAPLFHHAREDIDENVFGRPDFIGACWCGTPVEVSSIVSRTGYEVIPVLIVGDIVEFDPAILLQPGPACLNDGVDARAKSIAAVAERPVSSRPERS